MPFNARRAHPAVIIAPGSGSRVQLPWRVGQLKVDGRALAAQLPRAIERSLQRLRGFRTLPDSIRERLG